jgi:hypothetical protein
MAKIKFTIVALPEKSQLETLNTLRNNFYTNDFRYKNKTNTSDAHLSLAEGICNEEDISKVKEVVSTVIREFKPISTKYLKVTNDLRGPIEGKCEYDNAWISILFESDELQTLSKAIDLALKQLGISTTEEYIKNIHEGIFANKVKPSTVIANHINICNYCRPKMANEAQQLVKQKIPQTFIFNRIGFRYKSGQHAWELEL